MKRVDLTGQKFGEWTVDAKDPAPSVASRSTYWLVTCSCGTESSIRSNELLSGRSVRCRRHNRNQPRPVSLKKRGGPKAFKNLVGQKFNRWTVVARDPKENHPGISFVHWVVVCECGNKGIVTTSHLRAGRSKQCRECAWKATQEKCPNRIKALIRAGKLPLIESKKLGESSPD